MEVLNPSTGHPNFSDPELQFFNIGLFIYVLCVHGFLQANRKNSKQCKKALFLLSFGKQPEGSASKHKTHNRISCFYLYPLYRKAEGVNLYKGFSAKTSVKIRSSFVVL